MFHGPAFRGLTRSIAVSRTTMRGLITVPAAPGALLDNLGQFLGQWLVENQRDRWIALPARIARIDLHGPEPESGQLVECSLRVTGLDQDSVTVDGRLCRNGTPIMTVRGWADRRFDSDDRGGAVHRQPATSTVAERHPDGWWWAAERWHTLASRELYLQRYAGHEECAEYERLLPTRRRAWLLELVVVKDAVRGWLWDRGAGPAYPAELRVQRDASGRLRVSGQHGLDVPDLDVATAHHGDVAAAMVESAGSDPAPEVEITPWDGGDGTRITNPLSSRAYRVTSSRGDLS
jgi:hypothetical protein